MSYFDNIRTFVRVYELGSMSAAARDQRVSPAVASARITQLEGHLGVRLFQRTTRSLSATEQGRIFYDGACKILASVAEAEAGIEDVTDNPRGTLHVAAPLGVGRRLIAPHVPAFSDAYPLVDVRLRLSDRKLDLTAEGLDVAFFWAVRRIPHYGSARWPIASACSAPARPMSRRMGILARGPRSTAASTIASTCAFPARPSFNGSCKAQKAR